MQLSQKYYNYFKYTWLLSEQKTFVSYDSVNYRASIPLKNR